MPPIIRHVLPANTSFIPLTRRRRDFTQKTVVNFVLKRRGCVRGKPFPWRLGTLTVPFRALSLLFLLVYLLGSIPLLLLLLLHLLPLILHFFFICFSDLFSTRTLDHPTDLFRAS
jgi:hypothetical protein